MAGKTIEAGRGPGGFGPAIAVAAALCMTPVTGSAAPCIGTDATACLPHSFGFDRQNQRLGEILAAMDLLRRAIPLPGGAAPNTTTLLVRLARWVQRGGDPLSPTLFSELMRLGLQPAQGRGGGITPNAPPPGLPPLLFAGGLPGGGAGPAPRNGGVPFFRPGLSGQGMSFAPTFFAPGGGGGTPTQQIAPPPSPVPVPASLALLATGLGGLALMRRRRPRD